MLKSKEFQGGKDVEEQSVPGRKVCRRSKGFQEVKFVEKQRVLKSKGFQGAKGVKVHSVLRS